MFVGHAENLHDMDLPCAGCACALQEDDGRSLKVTLPEVYVQPGRVATGAQPAILRTLLGSCVGITFWSSAAGRRALCAIPCCRAVRQPAARSSLAAGRRYVDFAIRDLARQFDALGARRGEVQVKAIRRRRCAAGRPKRFAADCGQAELRSRTGGA